MSIPMLTDTAAYKTLQHDADPNHTHRMGDTLHSTYAIILAGGRGARLHELTDKRAKPAVPFGGKHRIVDFALSNCVNSGIRCIGVATQYMAHSLIQHLQRGWSFLDAGLEEFLDVLPAQQTIDNRWYDGTADAVFQNLDVLRTHSPRFVLVLAGDHVYKMNYSILIAEHLAHGADVSIACLKVPVSTASCFGVMQVDKDDRVIEFQEKPATPAALSDDPSCALVSMGIYLFNYSLLVEELAKDAANTGSSHDFGHDVLPMLLRKGRKLYAHRFENSCVNMIDNKPYWRDVGSLDTYWEANLDLTNIHPELNMYDAEWPIRTLQEQLPPAKFIFDSPDPRGQTVDALVSSGCIISGASIQRSLISIDVTVERGSVVENSVILPHVRVGRNVRLRRTVVDKYCELPDGFTAGFDSSEDQRRFYVSDKGIVLITPEMLASTESL